MAPASSAHPELIGECDTIASRRDLLRRALWGAGIILVVPAAWFDRTGLLAVAARTAPQFLTLAVVIAGGAIADRLGVFGLLARVVLSERVPTLLASTSLLTFTALISGAVNLDVAAVVAPPLAIRVATQRGLNAGRLVIASALTTNATSFLLPTSNITNLLVLNRSPIPLLDYVREGWAAWLLVTVFTVGLLALQNRRSTNVRQGTSTRSASARRSIPTILDLLPMFAIASAIRTVLGSGITLQGGFAAQFVVGSLLAAGANNLPAAAAVRTAASSLPWATILAMAMGPNLLITGSVASIICRRIALDLGVPFDSARFSLLGAAMLPLQFLMACAGLGLVSLE